MSRGFLPLALAILVAGVRPAAAQDPVAAYFGRPVAAVHMDVEGRPETSPALLALVAVKPGTLLRPEDVRDSIVRLYGIGRYDNVRVLAADAPGGDVDVTFSLTPHHPIDRMAFRGATGLASGELDRLVKEQYNGTIPTEVQPESAASVVQDVLEDEGYLQAGVTASIEQTHNPDRATLVFDVQAGPRATILSTTVRGTSPIPTDRLERQTGTVPGQPYRPRALEVALAGLRDDLRSHGYFTADAGYTPNLVPGGVELTLDVDAGPIVQLRWAGDGPPSGASDEELVPIRRENSADQDLLDDSRQHIVDVFQRQGYWQATVEYTRTTDGVLVVTFTTHRGPRARLDRVEVTGNRALTDDAVRDLMGLAPGDVLDLSKVQAGERQVTLAYDKLGFYLVKVERLAIEEVPGARSGGDTRVVVRERVTEGPQAHVTAVELTGAQAVPEAALRAVLRLHAGAPYRLIDQVLDRDNLAALYHDRGFRNAGVRVEPTVSADGTQVTIHVGITEGPQIIVDQISVVGNRAISEASIRQALAVHIGEPLSDAALLESQRGILATGQFRSVRISEQPRLPGETRAHLIITVEEAPPTTWGFGGGLEVRRGVRAAVGGGNEDFLEISPRGSFEIGRRNLGGKNRLLNLFSRVSARPRSAPGDPLRDGRGFGFVEYRFALTYQEPRAWRSDTDVLFGATFEQGLRTNFNFIRRAFNAELLHRVTPRVIVSGRYVLDFTQLLDERITNPNDQLLVDRLFPQVRLSMLSSGVSWDRRDQPIDPRRGTLLSADVEVAPRQIGSEVGYAKLFLQASGYQSLSASRRFVLAGRVQAGLARGFERQVVDENGVVQTVADLPASQRFYAGGSTTVRGFQTDRLGVAEIIKNGLSNGGNGVVVLNGELRTLVGQLFGHDFGVVGFTDVGNVFQKAGDIDLSRLRTAVGFGFRYDSPLGPVRLDFGFKLNPMTFGDLHERRWEYHLNIGEAF